MVWGQDGEFKDKGKMPAIFTPIAIISVTSTKPPLVEMAIRLSLAAF